MTHTHMIAVDETDFNKIDPETKKRLYPDGSFYKEYLVCKCIKCSAHFIVDVSADRKGQMCTEHMGAEGPHMAAMRPRTP